MKIIKTIRSFVLGCLLFTGGALFAIDGFEKGEAKVSISDISIEVANAFDMSVDIVKGYYHSEVDVKIQPEVKNELVKPDIDWSFSKEWVDGSCQNIEYFMFIDLCSEDLMDYNNKGKNLRFAKPKEMNIFKGKVCASGTIYVREKESDSWKVYQKKFIADPGFVELRTLLEFSNDKVYEKFSKGEKEFDWNSFLKVSIVDQGNLSWEVTTIYDNGGGFWEWKDGVKTNKFKFGNSGGIYNIELKYVYPDGEITTDVLTFIVVQHVIGIHTRGITIDNMDDWGHARVSLNTYTTDPAITENYGTYPDKAGGLNEKDTTLGAPNYARYFYINTASYNNAIAFKNQVKALDLNDQWDAINNCAAFARDMIFHATGSYLIDADDPYAFIYLAPYTERPRKIAEEILEQEATDPTSTTTPSIEYILSNSNNP